MGTMMIGFKCVKLSLKELVTDYAALSVHVTVKKSTCLKGETALYVLELGRKYMYEGSGF
jgi:hypothetical protein